ncbi:ABC transporter ATP-binding protein [Celerinatantimonas diazotrophica]|uniref:Iron complex transport system ATP-binding protein/vitamin B12 transport system ATP-binding protein n=1 Tax=Celerinatantimonas diazotrophica TaxID=412034 RepID=A0A4R1JL82_9GAMM|nr:ATP-binding cassette domain-containing protein [Celerinatantimonas diazotrophica]TCK51805.1 iron complex transport system ATP-binding protein/vitamin B12 transport system ATP-binding protein [Celerinatantimonas diazotrophica]CAG9296503.1 Vitamin B12 import ATP-binding protein BtuD [Celerinatantimonas diazotrophica]
MIEITDLEVRNYLVIEQLQIGRGQMVALCGANGAGKSTLLETLAGYIAPSRGAIQFLGQPIASYGVAELSQYRSWLAQQSQQRVYLCVNEQLQLAAQSLFGHSRPLAYQVIDEIIEQLSLSALLKRRLVELSGGELQRVSLASIFIGSDLRLKPEHCLLLLDEPLSALDPQFQHAVIHLLQDRCKQGQSILLSLHDLNLATFYAMDVLLLHQGRHKIMGPAQQVLTAPRLAELFGVSMAQININGHTQLILA